jgi:hypothetical protein
MLYRPARQHRLAASIPRNRFLGSINVYKYGLRVSFPRRSPCTYGILYSTPSAVSASVPTGAPGGVSSKKRSYTIIFPFHTPPFGTLAIHPLWVQMRSHQQRHIGTHLYTLSTHVRSNLVSERSLALLKCEATGANGVSPGMT